ncbi:hypothetical protein [Gallaecimonas sp. GXIMD1310]|uniref:hypothetical protein n=1 Tax=Gallaecimonas sp. GXIMD1310 TaxID=3131926 RepID=UPI00324F4F25
MRIQSTPYQPSHQPAASVPVAPAAAEKATPTTALVRYSAKGVAAAEQYQVQYDAPSSRNRRAIEQYQSLDKASQREQASSLLGVDLYV